MQRILAKIIKVGLMKIILPQIAVELQINRQTDKQINRLMDGWMDGYMNGWMDPSHILLNAIAFPSSRSS